MCTLTQNQYTVDVATEYKGENNFFMPPQTLFILFYSCFDMCFTLYLKVSMGEWWVQDMERSVIRQSSRQDKTR